MKAAVKSRLKIGGYFSIECRDKKGELKWRERSHNFVVNEGLDKILGVMFNAAVQITTWYIGLKGTGSVAAGDTLASHAAWTEFSGYTGNRQEFVENPPTGQSIDNSGSAASFSITGAGSVAGAFLCSVATGSAGTLFCAVDFATSRSVDNGDTVNVTYTLNSADDGV